MPREKDGYRDNLAMLNERFPDHDFLSMEEVLQVTGYTDRRTVKKYLGAAFVNNRISKVFLARFMCG